MLASRTLLPTCRTMPPRISSSTRLASSTFWPVWRSISSPTFSTTGAVELDRAGHRHVDAPVLLLPELVELAADAEDLRHPPLLDQQLEEVEQLGVGAADRAPQPRRLLRRGEVGAEEEDLQLAVAVDARRRTGRARRGSRRACPSPWPRRRGPRRIRELPRASAPRLLRAGESREVDLAQRLLDEAALVLLVERLAGDLLGRQHGEVGDLLADLLAASAASPLRCRGSPRRPAPRASPCRPSVASDSAVSAALRARAMMSSACSRASVRRWRYSASSSSDSLRCRSAASIDSLIVLARLSSASWIFGKATLLSTHIVKRKSTSVQIIRPRPGETRKLPPSSPTLLGERAGSDRLFGRRAPRDRPRGRRRSGRR